MKKSDILRQVRVLIEKRVCTYICFAIDRINESTARDHDEHCYYLKTWILDMLHRQSTCISYAGWLEVVHGINSYNYHDYLDKIREGRLAWIDWMITELEKDGE